MLVINGSDAQNAQNQVKSEPEYLSIEQSLLPATGTKYYNKSYGFPFHRINPVIKEYLLFYLNNDDSNEELTLDSLRLLGYVADEKEVRFLDDYIQGSMHKANVKNSDSRPAISISSVSIGSGAALGTMLKRDVKGANDLLKKYSDILSWLSESTNDMIKDETRKAYDYFIYQVYACSKNEDVLKTLKDMYPEGKTYAGYSLKDLEDIPTDRYSYTMSFDTTPEKTLQEKLNKELIENGGLEKLLPMLNKMSRKQWEQGQVDDLSNIHSPSKQSNEVTESILLTDPNQVGLLKSAVTEAIKAYREIFTLFISGTSQDLYSRLLVKGELLTSEKIEKLGDELQQGLETERAIIKDLDAMGSAEFTNFKVQIIIESSFEDINTAIRVNNIESPISGHNNSMMGAESAVVTFVISGTDDIYKKQISVINGYPSRDLIVYMKRINGKWYWNPFGW